MFVNGIKTMEKAELTRVKLITVCRKNMLERRFEISVSNLVKNVKQLQPEKCHSTSEKYKRRVKESFEENR